MLPQIERRYANPNELQINLMQCIRRALGIPELNRCVVTSTSAKTGRCYACVEDLFGTNVYKERREKLNTKVNISCSVSMHYFVNSILNLFLQNVPIAESISSRKQQRVYSMAMIKLCADEKIYSGTTYF